MHGYDLKEPHNSQVSRISKSHAQTLRKEQISLTPRLTDSLLAAVQPKLDSVIPVS